MEAPPLVHEVWSSLGLAGYYRHFIPYFSKIAKPMTRLLQKDEKFNWTLECEAAFHNLRTLLTTAPILAQPSIGNLLMCSMMHQVQVYGVFLCKKVELLHMLLGN